MSKKSLGVGVTILIAVMLVGNIIIIGEQSTLGKSTNPLTQKGSKIIQELKKKVSVLLAPCLDLGNSTNPGKLLQCQAAISQLEIFEETVSQEIAGFKGLLQQILRNIH